MADEDGWAGPRRHDEQGLGRLFNELSALKRDVAELKRGAPLRAAGIGASPDGLTVASSLNVEGSLDVSGDATIRGREGLTWTDSAGRERIKVGQNYPQPSGAEINTITYRDENGNARVWLGQISHASTGETIGHGLLVEDSSRSDMFAVWDGRGLLRTNLVWIESTDNDMTLLSGRTAFLTAENNVRITAGEIFSIRAGDASTEEWGVNVHSGSNGDRFNAIADDGFTLRTPNNSHRIHKAGDDIGVDAPNRFYVAANVYATGNLTCGGTKPFIIDHPLHEDKSLVHVAIEATVAEIVYPWPGPVTLDSDGQAELILPDYFEALAAEDYRSVWVQPVGRPFPTGADLVVDGKATVYGDPGRQVFVRVHGRRGDDAGQFEVEIPRIQPPSEEGDQP